MGTAIVLISILISMMGIMIEKDEIYQLLTTCISNGSDCHYKGD